MTPTGFMAPTGKEKTPGIGSNRFRNLTYQNLRSPMNFQYSCEHYSIWYKKEIEKTSPVIAVGEFHIWAVLGDAGFAV